MNKAKVKGCGTENADEKRKTFSIDDILTVAAATYCESVGKTAGDYDLVSVRCRTSTPFRSSYPANDYRGHADGAISARSRPPDIMEELARCVPKGTEKVADYRENIAMNNYMVFQYATGTALVPRK
ncbi:MAG: hypothetical protein AABX64_02160 [Nanoarchaeota archaeon]